MAQKCPVTGKQRHRSKGAAEAHKRALLKANATSEPELLVTFICNHCGGWHAGHNGFKRRPEPMPVQPKMQRSGGLRYKRASTRR